MNSKDRASEAMDPKDVVSNVTDAKDVDSKVMDAKDIDSEDTDSEGEDSDELVSTWIEHEVAEQRSLSAVLNSSEKLLYDQLMFAHCQLAYSNAAYARERQDRNNEEKRHLAAEQQLLESEGTERGRNIYLHQQLRLARKLLELERGFNLLLTATRNAKIEDQLRAQAATYNALRFPGLKH